MTNDVEQLLKSELEVAVGRVEHLDVLDIHQMTSFDLMLMTNGSLVVMLLKSMKNDSFSLFDIRLIIFRMATPNSVHDQRPTRDFGHSVLVREELADLVWRLERDVEIHLRKVGRYVELEAFGKSFGSWGHVWQDYESALGRYNWGGIGGRRGRGRG